VTRPPSLPGEMRASARQARRAIAAAVAIVALGSRLVVAQVPQAVETLDAAWRIIGDTHFDKTMTGLDWEAGHAEL
jgi:hypothetical protein